MKCKLNNEHCIMLVVIEWLLCAGERRRGPRVLTTQAVHGDGGLHRREAAATVCRPVCRPLTRLEY